MTEWYVFSEGYGTIWTPREVVLGRVEAIARLKQGFPASKITPDEARRMSSFIHSGICELHHGLLLVGYETEKGERIPDRRLTRVIGPGTEV